VVLRARRATIDATQSQDQSEPAFAPSFLDVGQHCVLSNWMIGAPGGKTPPTWSSRPFLFQQRGGAALGRITVLGALAAQGQALGGDVSEVLTPQEGESRQGPASGCYGLQSNSALSTHITKNGRSAPRFLTTIRNG